MIYYDLNLQVADFGAAVRQAKLLGFSGISAFVNHEISELKKISEGLDIVSSIMLSPRNPDELYAELDKNRKRFEIIAVAGGDYEVNRSACEDNRVDILLHPELGRMDSGIDHICAKAAADNSVAIEINFNQILNAKSRPRMIYFLKRNIYLCGKYSAPVITTSGARSIWDMRAPRELASVSHVLGMDLNRAIDSVSIIPEEKIKANREKLSGIRYGEVKVIEKGD